jgi:anti-sigma factor RsiW
MSSEMENHMECQDARKFIQGYLDGELLEAQAAPLRKHLLDCQPCRAGTQSEKNLRRWFVQPKAVPVPRDFAARVARRAFAGDRGDRFSEPELVGAGAGSGGVLLSMRSAREDHNLRFVLALTAVAAAVLMVISMSIRSTKLPSGMDLNAQSGMTIEEARSHLDQLNHKAAVGSNNPAASTVAPSNVTAPVPSAKPVVERKQ